MPNIEPLDREYDFEDDDEEDEDDDMELEIPYLDDTKVIRWENDITRRPVDTYNPGRALGLGNRFFSSWGQNSVILY